MPERLKFVARFLQFDTPMTDLCAEFGVSRQNGHKWVARGRQAGPAGLYEQSRARTSHPNVYTVCIRERIVESREVQPTWGPRKLVARVAKLDPKTDWPLVGQKSIGVPGCAKAWLPLAPSGLLPQMFPDDQTSDPPRSWAPALAGGNEMTTVLEGFLMSRRAAT